ncbi:MULTISPECIES: hypothetical protein [Enterobacterales]|uniref:Uncharacterized protein n=1 Tax=Proteus faecis TaxID=2050967 RepID=A0AAW7CQ16_9GAMM|nr:MULTISPECIES: hypothetical protein [Enterobacterales]EFN7274960.1 hypothetical protein [Escherichia coli O7:H7]MDO5405005.1 hypothetical protein [Proteus sp. (in: enterobacteria)]APL04615.1 hypothetical protein RG56_15495 [Escherichia coli]APL14398.1 hypothetical protein RG58_15480 [Escherichia coli]APL21357.1 hypothetical protein RG60_00430 [Escherichia coli]
MLGFSVGLIMLGFVVFFPVIYLIGYGFTYFDSWRLGKEIPRHKIKVNVVLGIILGVILGGVAQHIWDGLNGCMQLGYSFGKCFLMLDKM